MGIRRMRTHVLLGLIMAYFSVHFLPSAAGELVLTEEGEPRAAIIHNGHDDSGEVLQDYLGQITGAELPLAETSDEIDAEYPTAIKLSIMENMEGVSDQETAEHAYRLRGEDDTLSITALTEVGLKFAVYGLLQDHLGVGFFTPDFEEIPDSPTLIIPELDELQEPALYGRGVRWSGPRRGHMADYANKNRGYPLDGKVIFSGHNFAQYGVHDNCPLDEDFHEELGERLMEKFEDRDPEGSPMALGQRDGDFSPGCDFCDDCEALIEEEGSPAAPMFVMLNAALDHAGKKYPDHEIITFAYNNTLPVPETVRPHDNLWINIASSGGDHLNPLRGNPDMEDYYNAIRDWPEAAPDRVTIWHWARNYYAKDYEWPNMDTVLDTIRIWDEYGINAGFMQDDGQHHHWSRLRQWIWYQIMWNPEQERKPLMKRFFEGYYGKNAAPILLEYFDEAESVRREKQPSLWAHTSEKGMREELLAPDVVEKLDSILERAHETAGEEEDPIYEEHLAEARAAVMDKPYIDTMREQEGFTRVTDPKDDSLWYVAGGDETVPERIERYLERYDGARDRLDFFDRAGGRLFEIETEDMVVSVVPQKQCIEERSGANMVSVVHKPTDRELLAGDGYRTRPSWAREAYWDIDESGENSVTAEAVFSHPYWHFSRVGTMSSSVSASDDNQRVEVERSYHITKRHGSGDIRPGRYHAIWEFKLPEPDLAEVKITGGGLDERITTEELKVDPVELDLEEEGGVIVVELHRGDGLTVRLEAENDGWEGINIKPVYVDPEEDVPEFNRKKRSRWPNTTDVWPVDPTPRLKITLQDSEEAEINEPTHLPRQSLEVIQREE